MTDPTTTPSPDETRREAVDQPDGICAESVDDLRVPSPAKAAERVEAFVRWFGDGRVVIDYDLAAEDDDPPLYARDLNALTCAVQHGYRADEPSRCMHTATAVDDRRQALATLLGEMFEGGVLWSDVDAILALASRPAPVVSGESRVEWGVRYERHPDPEKVFPVPAEQNARELAEYLDARIHVMRREVRFTGWTEAPTLGLTVADEGRAGA